MDGKEGKVIVVSTREPSKDPNYRHGEAGVFYPNNDQNNIPPLREVSVKRHTESTYSFVLPMTPSTQEGGVALFHLLSLKNPTNAQSALSDMFRDAFRLHYDFNHNIQEIKPAETEESSLLKQWQIDDLQLSESEEFDSADVNTEASDTGLFLFDD